MQESFIIDKDKHILYDASIKFEPSWFDAHFLEKQGMLIGVTNIGRTQTFFFRVGEQEYVLKHFYRGGLLRFINEKHYIYTGQDRTRSIIEWRMIAYLHQKGFAVPHPVAACYTRRSMYYTASLITSSCRPAIPLSEFLGLNTLNPDLWYELGRLIHSIHEQGVYLPDLNASNILYDSRPRQFWFIDFDSAKLCPSGLSRRERSSNLDRLERSLEKISKNRPLGKEFYYTSADFAMLRDAYQEGS